MSSEIRGLGLISWLRLLGKYVSMSKLELVFYVYGCAWVMQMVTKIMDLFGSA